MNDNPFDKFYKKYEKWFSENEAVYKSELKAVKYFIPENKKGLEIGVGTGRFAGPLGIETGVEPSRSMGTLAEKKGIDVYYVRGENLPFNDNNFDLVLMITTLCFLRDVEKVFKEVKRVLKDKGRFVIGFMDKDSLLGKMYMQKKDDSVFYKKAEFHSTEEVIGLLKQHYFINIEIIETVFGNIEDIDEVQDFRKGYGEGGFVVIKAEIEK
ncbi:MAG: class I SAM-dependent methyltransferase [Bacillota bacterium]